MRSKKVRTLFAFILLIIFLSMSYEYAACITPTSLSYVSATPDFVALDEGYYEELISLSTYLRNGSAYTDISSASGDLLNASKLLVIPSGGLYGLENSTFLKAALDDYVKNGGTLVVFAQQHGYEFSILPEPQEADGTYRTVAVSVGAQISATFVPKDLPVEEVIFEKTIFPVNLSGSQTINTDIPALKTAAKFLLSGILKSNTTQEIARAEYPF